MGIPFVSVASCKPRAALLVNTIPIGLACVGLPDWRLAAAASSPHSSRISTSCPHCRAARVRLSHRERVVATGRKACVTSARVRLFHREREWSPPEGRCAWHPRTCVSFTERVWRATGRKACVASPRASLPTGESVESALNFPLSLWERRTRSASEGRKWVWERRTRSASEGRQPTRVLRRTLRTPRRSPRAISLGRDARA